MVLKLWMVESLRKDRDKWTDEALDKVRAAMLEKLSTRGEDRGKKP